MILTIALLLDIHSLEIHVEHTTRDSQAIPLLDAIQDCLCKPQICIVKNAEFYYTYAYRISLN